MLSIAMASSNIYTVSELTAAIKVLLEDRFPFVWLSGEISNFSVPASGHFYFTVKDAKAQISAVMFRGHHRNLKFRPENGMQVTGLGRISVYEPRGAYQIIFEHLEPKGLGALQAAFEQLKARLSQEGLFDEQHKQPLPKLPRKIAVITSPSGAVVHDILSIIQRRFSNMPIQIIPAQVQGEAAEVSLVAALERLAAHSDADVAIVARGGGSLEDLQAFNDEAVARAIFASPIPVVSAVGHETDFTIADFVADLRAPTPSAAAELVAPLKVELEERLLALTYAMRLRIANYLKMMHKGLQDLDRRLVHPRRRLEDMRLRLDDYHQRLLRALERLIASRKDQLRWRIEKLWVFSPSLKLMHHRQTLQALHRHLIILFNEYLKKMFARVKNNAEKLYALSPQNILARGYSITRTIPDGQVVSDSGAVAKGQMLQIRLYRGELACRVEGKDEKWPQ